MRHWTRLASVAARSRDSNCRKRFGSSVGWRARVGGSSGFSGSIYPLQPTVLVKDSHCKVILLHDLISREMQNEDR